MGNPFGMFEKDPQDLPGQGLARADNFRYGTAGNEYNQMLQSLLANQSNIYATEAAYAPKYQELAQRNLLNTITGSNGVPGISALYSGALRSADPGQAMLMDKLTTTANTELDRGAMVDPQLLEQAQQSVRGRTLQTLGSTGKAGDFQEALGISAFANQLRNERRAFAARISGMNDARYAGVPAAALGISAITTPSLVNPATQAGLLNTAYSENQANNRATADNETRLAEGFIGMASQFI